MTRTCAIDGYRDATCTIDWDGRVVAACDDCAGVTPEPGRLSVISATERKLSTAFRIVQYVHDHGSEGLSAAGVADALGLSVNSVSSVLCRMAEDGFVVTSGHRAARLYRPGAKKPAAGRWYRQRGMAA